MAHYRTGMEKLKFVGRLRAKARAAGSNLNGKREGPQVAQPTRQGFGTTLLRAVFPDARFDYAVEGLTCEIDVLLRTDEPDAVGSLSFANE